MENETWEEANLFLVTLRVCIQGRNGQNPQRLIAGPILFLERLNGTVPMYHETQRLYFCGIHALNNLLGGKGIEFKCTTIFWI